MQRVVLADLYSTSVFMRKFLFSLLLGVPMAAQAQAPAPFVLKGKLAKTTAPTKVYLWRGSKGVTDSAIVANGSFELRGTVEMPGKARLFRAASRKMVGTRQADNTTFYLTPGTSIFSSPDSLAHATVSGAKLTNEFEKLQAQLKPSKAKMDALMLEYRAASAEQRRQPDFMKRLDEREEAITQEHNQVLKAHIAANPASQTSLDAVEELGGAVPDYAEVAPLFAQLSPAVQATPSGKKYAAKLELLKAVAVGAVAPDFTLNTPEGKPVALSSLRGKYVLVDFWASWCGPCRQENPNVTKIYNEYKSRNFDILGVSLDTEKAREKWLKAIQDDQLAWTQVSDLKGWQNAAATRYGVQAIPQNFLLDPSGKIVATNLRGDNLKNTLAKFIK